MNQTLVLFVDDDSNVLSALRRMLHAYRGRWQMHFANGGREALEKMKELPFDVVITDMRMPDMDGVAVLRAAKEYTPAAIRAVLSGQSDCEQTIRVLETAHQFVSKPCDLKTLESVILKAQSLKAELPLHELKVMATSLSSLPVVERNLNALKSELQSEQPSIDRLSAIVATDIALTAKVLQLVRSSFFGQPSKLICPAAATKLLGIELLRELVIHRNLFHPFRSHMGELFSIEELTRHSIEMANSARSKAVQEDGDPIRADEAYVAGLLHDVGKLMLAEQFSESFGAAVSLANCTGSPLWLSEVHVFGISHAEIGSYLLALWGLPESVVDSVASYRHHAPTTPVHSPGVKV